MRSRADQAVAARRRDRSHHSLRPRSPPPPHCGGRAWPAGSGRARASKYNLCSRTGGNVLSRSFQDGQHGHAAAEKLESAAIGGNVLMMAGAEAKEVAQFIVCATEPSG